MEFNTNAGCLTSAIAAEEIKQFADQIFDQLRKQVVPLIEHFAQSDPTPKKTLDLENRLHDRFRETGRELIQWLFSRLEPAIEQMPGTITHHGKYHRRLGDKSRRADVLTRFGKVSFLRGRYRRGRSGRTIFPLEMLLGIENGFTPAAADRVGKQFAATGSSQGRTLEMVADQMGSQIGTEKLRKLVGTLADGMAAGAAAGGAARMLPHAHTRQCPSCEHRAAHCHQPCSALRQHRARRNSCVLAADDGTGKCWRRSPAVWVWHGCGVPRAEPWCVGSRAAKVRAHELWVLWEFRVADRCGVFGKHQCATSVRCVPLVVPHMCAFARARTHTHTHAARRAGRPLVVWGGAPSYDRECRRRPCARQACARAPRQSCGCQTGCPH